MHFSVSRLVWIWRLWSQAEHVSTAENGMEWAKVRQAEHSGEWKLEKWAEQSRVQSAEQEVTEREQGSD